MRVFIQLAYDGTNFSGWQIQPKVDTVQGAIQEALSSIFNQDITITGCGRTDSGVHATYYIAHADLPSDIDMSLIRYKLNRMLSKDVVIDKIREVAPEAHARFDAKTRAYAYKLHFIKNPFIYRYSTYLPRAASIDHEKLVDVADLIKKTKEFGSFCKLHGADTHMKCNIFESHWDLEHASASITYTIRANRFLRGMVRLIVGSSLAVATGQLTFADLEKHVQDGTRNALMKSAPPQGLALIDVTYESPLSKP